MITQFHIEGYDYHCKNFPVDLRIGEIIWMDDFKNFLKKGDYYCPSDDYVGEMEADLMKVISITYAFIGGTTVIKMIELKRDY